MHGTEHTWKGFLEVVAESIDSLAATRDSSDIRSSDGIVLVKRFWCSLTNMTGWPFYIREYMHPLVHYSSNHSGENNK